ncbi:class I SAM-dependent methyltransferase [Nocardiopsis sp. MG754419]|uniref:class I SAM-dependent DNA methyltransferase n=1 Tax=Nocardiopsis sp. MG754419 TaxID=2259865 RepID=UPI001BAC7117|nr:class I SAM-dependent methyltransferase [Nocardiopsis sp. MG754419]MBR8744027.1 SAM-dependent methyltransferase [Nocardiopsis sp. MG754419]
MTDFSTFDTRRYRTVDVATGYDGWSATYEASVLDAMDLDVLAGLTTPDWGMIARAADLGCGTGRTADWLRGRGVPRVDGVDLSAGMLARARQRGAHTALSQGDVRATGLPGTSYDLVIASLIDEHLPDLAPLYGEAWRLARPGAHCVLVAYHPQFIMVSGMPTHFTDASGEDIAISTHVHLISDHVRAASAAGWRLTDLHEAVVDDAWVAAKPTWERFRGHPISAVFVWSRPS